MGRKVRKARAKIREVSPNFNRFDLHDCNEEDIAGRNMDDRLVGVSDRQSVDKYGIGDPITDKRSVFDEVGPNTDWLDFEACIVCDLNEDPILRCHGKDCPIVVHERCLDHKLDYDQLGYFYCPYCWFKRESRRHGVLRDGGTIKGKLAATDKFLCRVIPRGEEENAEETETRACEMACDSTRDYRPCSEGMNDDIQNHSAQHDANMITAAQSFLDLEQDLEFSEPADTLHSTQNETGSTQPEVDGPLEKGRTNHGSHKTIQPENAKMVKEIKQTKVKKQVLKGKKRIQADQPTTNGRMHMLKVSDERRELQCPPVGKEGKHIDSEVLSFQCPSDSLKGADQDQHDILEEQKQEASKSPVVSPRDLGKCTEDDQLALVIYQGNNLQQAQTGTSLMMINPMDKRSSIYVANSGVQGGMLVGTVSAGNSNSFNFLNGKRKRLMWTDEEEEMLRVGVHVFSAMANKNLPWRKILEYGQAVFHEDRTPMDLKDKWKKMKRRYVAHK